MKKLLCVVAGLMLLFIGCGGGERASIIAGIFAFWDNDTLKKEADIEGYKYNGFKIVPLITVNGDTVPIEFFDYSPTDFFYHGPINWVNLGDECKFEVDYDEGEGKATDSLPREFSITSPDTSYILHKGNSLNITWGSASGADWYWLDVFIDYSYMDTAGNYEYFYFYLDTIMDGTSYTLNASRIFPGDVDTVLWGDGNISVEGVSGPKILPGAEGNIKGDAVGFFWCSYEAKPVDIDIEQFAGKPEKDHQAEVRKMHREAMRKFALENE